MTRLLCGLPPGRGPKRPFQHATGGLDASHDDHLHPDVVRLRDGGRLCQEAPKRTGARAPGIGGGPLTVPAIRARAGRRPLTVRRRPDMRSGRRRRDRSRDPPRANSRGQAGEFAAGVRL